jgi:hypothetical protein
LAAVRGGQPPRENGRLPTPTTPPCGSATTGTGPRCPRPGASCARRYTSSPTSATTRSPSSDNPQRPQWSLGDDRDVDVARPAANHDGVHQPRPAPARPLSGRVTAEHRRRGRPYETERPHPPAGGGSPNQSSCRRHISNACLKAIGKPGCPPDHTRLSADATTKLPSLREGPSTATTLTAMPTRTTPGYSSSGSHRLRQERLRRR